MQLSAITTFFFPDLHSYKSHNVAGAAGSHKRSVLYMFTPGKDPRHYENQSRAPAIEGSSFSAIWRYERLKQDNSY